MKLSKLWSGTSALGWNTEDEAQTTAIEGTSPNMPSPLSLEAFRDALRTIDAIVTTGKGATRHQSFSFEEADVWEVCRRLDSHGDLRGGGAYFLLGQADKKIREYGHTGDLDELLDAAAYLIFTWLWQRASVLAGTEG